MRGRCLPAVVVMMLGQAIGGGLAPAREAAAAEPPARTTVRVDLSRDKRLYVVGYAHLDTEWRWDYVTTISEYLRDTLEQNFDLLARYPDYTFSFTGAARYALMKEYYPRYFERMKEYVRAGRWHVAGSSVDENDVNIPSAESIFRQILYGNGYFRRELGVESVDYMLPDCFGFPASLPSIFAHSGLAGFSTQKLTWGSAVGVPFNLGVWVGPDGRGIVSALNPGDYDGGIAARLDTDPEWVRRVEENGTKYGVWADYHYYGVGDEGGAPHDQDVHMLVASLRNPDGKITVVPAAADQLFRDIRPEQMARLPHYRGDLLLTQHSAGSLTSEAYMKRWNRKNEQLADAAERAAVLADWLGGQPYPMETLRRGWMRVLGSQFHDIMAGTSTPRAYQYAWNDEVIGLNQFASVLTSSAGVVSRALDTRVRGLPLVVYNPLALDREDLVEAVVHFHGKAPAAVQVFAPDGKEMPAQLEERHGETARVVFVARVPAVGWAVYDVRPAPASDVKTGLRVGRRSLENDHYRVRLDDNGDIASIVDKAHGARELLSGPAQLQFLGERPEKWPAWNMDWTDRQKPPAGVVGGPATVRVVESGPARVALEVTRSARGSIFTQRIRLAAGAAGERVELDTHIDWQTTGVSLKAAFPLRVANERATYNWGVGTISRGNDDPKKYEVPSHEWLDLTDAGGGYGVTVLEDSKYGSDKPDDHTLRLTLLYTPAVRQSYQDQATQDWGRHDVLYALYGHGGDWRDGRSEWQGRRLNQPLVAFQVEEHAGTLGKRLSFASVSTPQLDVRALKQAEDGGATIVRLQELWGKPVPEATVSFAAPVAAAWEVDGQERRIAPATVRDGRLVVAGTTAFSPRTFAVRLAGAKERLAKPEERPLALPFDTDVMSTDGDRFDGDMAEAMTFPAEQLPSRLATESATFTLGSGAAGAKNALTCRGQQLPLPAGFDQVSLLLAATRDTEAEIAIGAQKTKVHVPSWTGFIGQFDTRVWSDPFRRDDYRANYAMVGLVPGYIKRAPLAWFATHRHHPERGNEAYQFSYLFEATLPVPPGAQALVLPHNERVRVFAVTAQRGSHAREATPVQPLYDDFSGRGPLTLRVTPPAPNPIF